MMQLDDNIAFSESNLNSSKLRKIKELQDKLRDNKIEWLNRLTQKHDSTVYQDLISEDDTLNARCILKEIDSIYLGVPDITLKLSQRKEAVISAILININEQRIAIDDFIEEIKDECIGINDLCKNLKKIKLKAKNDLVYSVPHYIIAELHKQVEIEQEMVSKFYEKCFQFLCSFEESLRKIRFVLSRN